jgi:Alpha-L-fucosidase
VDTVSKGGLYMLNISPMADGTIPADHQEVLRKIGAWLHINGEAIFGTHPWTKFADGIWHFTTKDNTLYAIAPVAPEGGAVIAAVADQRVESVALLGHAGPIEFQTAAGGLHIKVPSRNTAGPLCFKIRVKLM